ncbi:MAG: class I SAM-dependent methyltransferase [Chloroflexaceae bacterium]|nr:class I SAM-dependent methyltransferase [Chloroflexaceae bacterium]
MNGLSCTQCALDRHASVNRDQPMQLQLLPIDQYAGVNRDDPIRFYHWPILGSMYRRRVELCLEQCRGGERILEIGFGSGVTFLNLQSRYRQIYGLDLTASAREVTDVFVTRGLHPQLLTGSVLDMPFTSHFFDTVLLISILEHLYPEQQDRAFREIARVLKPGGQVVYGVPIEHPFMTLMFRLLGYDIRQYHFSTEGDVARAANRICHPVQRIQMQSTPSIFGAVYEVGHFITPDSSTAILQNR